MRIFFEIYQVSIRPGASEHAITSNNNIIVEKRFFQSKLSNTVDYYSVELFFQDLLEVTVQ